MYDLSIIGGGPAGIAAAVYAARKGIENWIGTPRLLGTELSQRFVAHLEAVKGDMVESRVGERATKLEKMGDGFKVETKSGKAYEAHAVLVASGAGRKKLEVPGAAEFENKGVTYCASCDGLLFAGMDVVVVGGGNAGFETALQLLAYCKSVTLIHRHQDFKADAVTVEKASAHPNMRIIRNAEPTEVLGEQFVTGLKYKDKGTGEVQELAVSGIFVEAGVIPNTAFAEEFLEMDAVKRIKVNPRNQRASVEGVWAAGDCTDELYHQNNIAAGDGVKALEDIYLWLKKR